MLIRGRTYTNVWTFCSILIQFCRSTPFLYWGQRLYVLFMYVASQHMFILMLNLPVIRCNQQLLMKNIYHMQNKCWHWHHFRRLCVCGCECACLQEKGTEPQRGHPTPFTRNKSSTPPRSLLSFHLVYRETWWWREGRKILMHTPKIEN